MKARIPKHREFIIDFPQDMDQAKADELEQAERDRRGVQEGPQRPERLLCDLH